MSSKRIATAAAVIGFCVVALPAQSAPLSVDKSTQAVGAGDVQQAHYGDKYYRYHRYYPTIVSPAATSTMSPAATDIGVTTIAVTITGIDGPAL